MASPNSVFTEIVTTTFRNHSGEIADNVTKHNALYRKLKTGGRTRKENGGYSIVAPLEYAQNQTYQRYSGFDVLNVTQSDVFTAAEYPWRQIALNVVSSGFELRVNSGPQQIANLAKKRIRNAINTFANNFSADLYGDGTLPNQVSGLQALVADAGTGTVGGIDSSVWTFWQNTVASGTTPSSGNIESLMLGAYISLTRGADKPDMIVMSDDYFALYETSQTAIKRYASSDAADGGFMELMYKGTPVFFDGSSGMLASRAYFLNTNYIEVVVHSDANLTPMDEAKPYNQDAVVVPMIWMGNMITSNRKLQGVLKA
jgi:hypothetical protein